jgi:polysaccharide pyruvyl transferase WcaK-like protein
MSESKRKNEDINAIWEYKVIYEDKLYKLVEDFGKFGYAEVQEADTLEELAQLIMDDFTARITAIKTYQEDTKDK